MLPNVPRNENGKLFPETGKIFPEGLVYPLRRQPLPVLRVGDLELLDRLPDRFLLVHGTNMPDIGRRAALDTDDPTLLVFSGLLGHMPKGKFCLRGRQDYDTAESRMMSVCPSLVPRKLFGGISFLRQ
jgi:hypothetical protein